MSLLFAAVGSTPVVDVHAGSYTNLPGSTGFITYQSDGGVLAGLVGSSGSYQGDWVTPTSRASDDYEIQVTVSSGALSAGQESIVGVWLALSTTRTWAVDVSGTATLSVQIRDSSDTVVASGSVTITGGGTI